MTSSLRIIVSGLLAQYPLGGVAWDYLQYVLGFKKLGHEVFYMEDTGQWPFNPLEKGTARGPDYTVSYLTALMKRYDLEENWAYRFPREGQWFGISDQKRQEVIGTADLVINVSGVLRNPADYKNRGRLVFIDSDPVFTQLKIARGQRDFQDLVDEHDIQFSFGESFSDEMPDTGHTWHPTRQPVVLSEWEHAREQRDVYTTIMNWTSYKPIKFEGKTYGQKDLEFKKFIDLPSIVDKVDFELAINAGKTNKTPYELLRHKGWGVVNPEVVCPDMDSYRKYIQTSKAEWSIAKNGYVMGQSGWFSCRSACYLASGRPVIVQDTGFSKVLTTGRGIVAFSTLEGAVAAIEDVEGNYDLHSDASRELAGEYFDSGKVLSRLVSTAYSGNQ